MTRALAIRQAIRDTPGAHELLRGYLRRLGVQTSGRVSATTLGAVCGVTGRTWQRWEAGDRPMPESAARLLAEVCRINLPGSD